MADQQRRGAVPDIAAAVGVLLGGNDAAGGGLKGWGHDKHRPGLTAETEAEGTPAIGAEALHGFKGGGEIGGVQLLRAAHGLLPEAVPAVAAVTDAVGDLVLHEDIVVVRIGDDLQFRGAPER